MSDIFISYAHEDQPFVKRMVPALEAEGFSVWWDHTIPPGKSWDTFIAKGIEEARCCIVVWSPHSAASDWVKEEATLGKAKLLPVQLGVSEPPVGFRRIQAANLQNWNGERDNPQWQLLVGEARSLIGAARSAGPAPTRSYSQPAPAPSAESKSPPWALLGGLAVAAVAIVAFFMFSNRPTTTPDVEAPTEFTEVAPAETTTPPTVDASAQEIEQLRRERDELAAAQRASEQRANDERAAQARQQQAAADARVNLVAGVWTGTIDWGDGTHRETTWTMNADGTMVNRHGERGTWSLNGRTMFVDVMSVNNDRLTYNGTIDGNGVFSGRAYAYMGDGISGTFRMSR